MLRRNAGATDSEFVCCGVLGMRMRGWLMSCGGKGENCGNGVGWRVYLWRRRISMD